MTELETRLMDALKALSSQWAAAAAARRGTGHVEREGHRDLAQLVTDFARQHEQHAATLQAQTGQCHGFLATARLKWVRGRRVVKAKASVSTSFARTKQ